MGINLGAPARRVDDRGSRHEDGPAPRLARLAGIAAPKRHGLATRIAPWGVGGIFGGEGMVEAGRTPQETLAWWLSSAHELQPDAMLWDEPQGARGLRAMTKAMTTLPI